jgi:hypothetical protein
MNEDQGSKIPSSFNGCSLKIEHITENVASALPLYLGRFGFIGEA